MATNSTPSDKRPAPQSTPPGLVNIFDLSVPSPNQVTLHEAMKKISRPKDKE